jgi:hypothetical protein
MKTALLALAMLAGIAGTAHANNCVITAPGGVAAYLRASPGGSVIGQIRNGTPVYMGETAYDSSGQQSVHVGRGWVFREYITCRVR